MKIEKETVRLVRTDGGCLLVPADGNNCALLALLHGDADEIGKVIEMDADALLLDVCKIAKDQDINALVCGNRKTHPVIKLWHKKASKAALAPIRKIFEGLGYDGAKWGVSDFYDEHEKVLRNALKDGLPFDTGWYSVKKEIESGRVCRSVKNGPITIEVSASMDEGSDLADTALWRAAGGNSYCDSGFNALEKLGFTEDEAFDELSNLADGYEAETTESDSCTLHWKSGFKSVTKALNSLCENCSQELKSTYEGFIEYCKDYVDGLKRNRNASCMNCKHFQKEIAESHVNPGEPADCGHPKYWALLSANKAFPFKNGCKFWESK